MNVYSDTNIGLSREENQDRVRTAVLGDNSAFAVVCDGMGGENAGSEASERAVGIIYDRITKVLRPDSDGNSIRNLMISSITTANAVVYDLALSSTDKKGMGTTCVVALRIGNKLYIASVGDSRAYIINHEIIQVTKDHSIVMQMYENGEITKEDIKNHPHKNYITKAIGVSASLIPDFFEIDIPEASAVILCSDGFSNYCDESVLFSLVKKTEPDLIAEKLIKYALDNGGNDNITVAVII